MSSTQIPPGAQITLARLFELFSKFVEARGDRKKSEIHGQILELFKQLGIFSGLPVVREVAKLMENTRFAESLPKKRNGTIKVTARNYVASRIAVLERDKGISLSGDARLMLRTPIAEASEIAEKFEPEVVSDSLNRLFDTLAEPPTDRSEGAGQSRTSIAVVRALWKNFCRIPPICTGKAAK